MLLDWEVPTAFPVKSYREFAIGVTVTVSFPSASPAISSSKSKAGPLPPEIDRAVPLASVAVPPDMEKVKSLVSGFPDPVFALKISLPKVTVTLVL